MRATTLLGASLAALTATAVDQPADAGPAACGSRTNNTQRTLLECVTLEGVREHQWALQSIADANNGTRATGTSGYDESVDYVVETLEAAGYQVELDPFDFVFLPPVTLDQLAPIMASYASGAFTGSSSGEVTGPV